MSIALLGASALSTALVIILALLGDRRDARRFQRRVTSSSTPSATHTTPHL